MIYKIRNWLSGSTVETCLPHSNSHISFVLICTDSLRIRVRHLILRGASSSPHSSLRIHYDFVRTWGITLSEIVRSRAISIDVKSRQMADRGTIFYTEREVVDGVRYANGWVCEQRRTYSFWRRRINLVSGEKKRAQSIFSRYYG